MKSYDPSLTVESQLEIARSHHSKTLGFSAFFPESDPDPKVHVTCEYKPLQINPYVILNASSFASYSRGSGKSSSPIRFTYRFQEDEYEGEAKQLNEDCKELKQSFDEIASKKQNRNAQIKQLQLELEDLSKLNLSPDLIDSNIHNIFLKLKTLVDENSYNKIIKIYESNKQKTGGTLGQEVEESKQNSMEVRLVALQSCRKISNWYSDALLSALDTINDALSDKNPQIREEAKLCLDHFHRKYPDHAFFKKKQPETSKADPKPTTSLTISS